MLLNYISNNKYNYATQSKNQIIINLKALMDQVMDLEFNNKILIILKDKGIQLMNDQLQMINSISFNSIIKYIDKFYEGGSLYYLCSIDLEQFYLIEIRFDTNNIKYYSCLSMFLYDKLCVTEIIDLQLMLLDGILLKDNTLYYFQLRLQEVEQQAIQILDNIQITNLIRLSKNKYLFQALDSIYIMIDTNLHLFQLNIQVKSIFEQNGILFISDQQNLYLINLSNDQCLQYQLNINGFTFSNNKLYFYNYNYNDNKKIKIINADNIMQIEQIYEMDVKQIQNLIIINNSLLLINDNSQLKCIFRPDFTTLLNQLIQITPINQIEQQKNNLKLYNHEEEGEEYYFQLVKKTKQNIDDIMQIAINRSYLQLLLLMSARIRVFRDFFILCQKISQNKNEFRIRNLMQLKTFRQCECFEKQYLLEEFVDEILNRSHQELMVYFIKFLIENPKIIQDIQYQKLLTLPIERNHYEIRNLVVPIIPKDALIKQLAQLKFLKISRQSNYLDYCRIKESNLKQFNRGISSYPTKCYVCRKLISYSDTELVLCYSRCHHAIHQQCQGQRQHNCQSNNIIL